MTILRKRPPVDGKAVNGLYVHSNPPRILSVSAAHIKHLIRNGDIDRLEQLVLEGQGKKMVGEYSADYRTRTFLKSVPALMSKIALLHDSLNSDRLAELQSILDEEPERKKKLILAKDDSGVGLLHKAVYYDLKSIYRWLIDKFPHSVNSRDSEGRTPYFYTLMCKDPATVQKLLTLAGADPHVQDCKGHSVKYYGCHLQELELPNGLKSVGNSRKSTATKESLNFKKSNIRIWIHQRNMANLQQVIWDGHGPKLLVEHSNNPKMRKFLEAVPYIMGIIKDVHCDVQNGDLDSLKNRISPPVPLAVLSAKDTNGLTPLHKAVGLGKEEIAHYIIEQIPYGINAVDNDGKTPLHYAALLKDDHRMFNYLIKHGADESVLDNRQKTAAYYKTRASEIDSKVLHVVPDCPRGAKEPNSFDWGMLSAAVAANGLAKKLPEKVANGLKESLGLHDSPERKQTPEAAIESPRKSFEAANDARLDEVTEIRSIEGEDNKVADTPEEEQETAEVETPNDNPSPDNSTSDAKVDELDQSNNDGEHESPPNEEEPLEKTENSSEQMVEGSDNDLAEAQGALPEEPKEEKEGLNSTAETKPESENSVLDSPVKSLSSSRPGTGIEKESANKSEEHEETEIEGEGVIEGVVNGEHEIESTNNEGQNRLVTDDEDIRMMIASGNMEQLAALVLNGHGEKLIGEKSNNQELQTFLDNVPVYMAKIKRIHVAAREGSLRDLQAALDRRKFAVARDNVSPNGASPLHVAVAFGRTSVVRYLAGRFPETVHVEDTNGRTPLHYAAVLRDNGHYYNLLTHLGADNRIKDKLGNTPAFYTKNQQDFNHRLVLKEFGAEDHADEFGSNNEFTLNGEATEDDGQIDMPFFATEEGRYLASSLGDPLIKGLTEVANKRPEDPIAYLATYLYNFARSRDGPKSRGRTQESHQNTVLGGAQTANESNAVPATIEVVTVEPDENEVEDETAFNRTSRDEHGQSMIHFAAARTHGRNALFQLLLETEINLAYRDELYRTARDISIQASIPENTSEIDRYVLHIAAKGDTSKLVELLLDGYDHITDIVNEDDTTIIDVVAKENQHETVSFLQSILTFEEKRERVHHAIRQGSIANVMALLADENDTGSGKLLAIGKNSYGRCSLHIAVLCQQEEIVDYLVNTFVDTLRIGDNLERTALHYAMGVEKMETISRLLIKGGAKRVVKDLKGRQPTYYFLNKSDILRLQEEEETF
uniref:Uncharacterized protein n=3 Tax=Dendroctonus ponderosae TaxID=77166 RepID=A0AAR5PMT0_DENPD